MQHRLKAWATRGFTLIEMLMAIALLAVVVSALVGLIPFATQQNANNRWDTAGMVWGQRVLEQMRAQGACPQPPGTAVGTPCSTTSSFTLCDTSMSTASTCPVAGENKLTINMAAGGCPLTAGGDIDWGQPVSACGTNYAALFSESSNPQAPRIRVRWNVQVNGANQGKLVVISGRKTLADVLAGRGTILPATLRLFIAK